LSSIQQLIDDRHNLGQGSVATDVDNSDGRPDPRDQL
jgi:hypothetical protein